MRQQTDLKHNNRAFEYGVYILNVLIQMAPKVKLSAEIEQNGQKIFNLWNSYSKYQRIHVRSLVSTVCFEVVQEIFLNIFKEWSENSKKN